MKYRREVYSVGVTEHIWKRPMPQPTAIKEVVPGVISFDPMSYPYLPAISVRFFQWS
jgi:hypothetical protein